MGKDQIEMRDQKETKGYRFEDRRKSGVGKQRVARFEMR
jgi:hypothetical protein